MSKYPLYQSLNYQYCEQQDLGMELSGTRRDEIIFHEFEGKSFPYRLFSLLNNPLYDEVIRWCPDGDCIIFPDEVEFESRVLQTEERRLFKTRKMKSFVRQLNLYGFHKVTLEKNEGLMKYYRDSDRRFWPDAIFEHRYGHFKKSHPELLEYVRRTVKVPPGK